jgi:F0F1-type ATP synthase gamma subunit
LKLPWSVPGVSIGMVKDMLMGNRKKVFLVWERNKNGIKLRPDEQELLEILRMHPEWEPIYSNPQKYAKYKFDPRKEEDPFVHILLHQMLRKQMKSKEMPEMQAAYERLARKKGAKAAEEAILDIFLEEVAKAVQQKKMVNLESLKARLSKL